MTPKDLSELKTPFLETPSRTITDEGLKSCAASVLPADSVLLSSRAPIGLVAINSVPLATNQGFKSLVPKRNRLDSKYLYHWLRSKTEFLQSLGNGATFKEISKAIVERIEVPLPPLDEQRRIAAILDKADVLRRNRKCALDLLDSLTQSIFLEMFGSLGDNSSLWDTRTVSEVCELIVDCVNRTAPVVAGVTPYKMIRTTNVRDGSVDLRDVRFVSEETFSRWNRRTHPKRGDVLLTREAPVGGVGMLEADDKVFLGQRLMLYRPDARTMTSDFLVWSFQDKFLRDQFDRFSSGSTVKHLSLPACREFELRVPPIDLQQLFSKRLEKLKALLSASRAQIAEGERLFDSLQHRAFSGQL